MNASAYQPTVIDRLRWFFLRQWQRAFPPKSNLIFHAEQELRAAGMFDEDSDYDGMAAHAVMELIQVFSRQGHSGFSANLVRGLFNKVAAYEPLCPLTGADDEWVECSTGMFQNKRCSHVFKENGQAYDIDGRIFREPSGSCYTNRESRVNVTFPYSEARVRGRGVTPNTWPHFKDRHADDAQD